VPDSGELRIYRGDGHGGLALTTAVALNDPTSVAVGDFTGDGRRDIAVGEPSASAIVLLAGTPDGFAPVAPYTAQVVATRLIAADTDGDGNPDLVALDSPAGVAVVIHGDGAGAVEGVTLDIIAGGATPGIAGADYDGSGRPDFAISVPDAEQVLVDLSRRECIGDCNVDGQVAISERIIDVNIGLGAQSVRACRRGDADRDGAVEINEIIAAVNDALVGCPIR
jgi:hypothetical protein